jgi:hypothetical protein
MRGIFMQSIVLGFLIPLGSWASDDANSTARLSMTVRLYNTSSASERDLKEMKESASRVFSHSGIDIEWFPCEPGPRDSAVCTDHGGPENRTIIFAQLIDVPVQRKQGRNQTRPALLGRVNHVAASVAVFYTTARTMEQDAQGIVTKGQILGYALAHEIGHLLLGSNDHSLAGIMKETFGRNELSDMGMERLLFTSAEVRSIRERLSSPAGPTASAKH